MSSQHIATTIDSAGVERVTIWAPHGEPVRWVAERRPTDAITGGECGVLIVREDGDEQSVQQGSFVLHLSNRNASFTLWQGDLDYHDVPCYVWGAVWRLLIFNR